MDSSLASLGEELGQPHDHARRGDLAFDSLQRRSVHEGCLGISFIPNSILVSLVKMRLLACISQKCYLSLSTIRRTGASHEVDAEDGDSTRTLAEFLQADGEERRIFLCLARLKSGPFKLMAIFSREDHEGGDEFVVAVLFVLIDRIQPGAW